MKPASMQGEDAFMGERDGCRLCAHPHVVPPCLRCPAAATHYCAQTATAKARV